MADDEVFQEEYFFTDAQLALLAAAIFAVSLGLPIFYGKRLATWAPHPSSRTARLFPLLLPLLFFFNVVIEFGRPDKLLLVYLTPYALLLFTFCLSYRREQRKEKAASCRDTSPEQEKQTYPHYPLTTVKMTFFLLLSLAFLLPALFFVCGVAPSENSSPWWHSIIMPPFTLAGIVIPLLCGHWLASEAPFPPPSAHAICPSCCRRCCMPPLPCTAVLHGFFQAVSAVQGDGNELSVGLLSVHSGLLLLKTHTVARREGRKAGERPVRPSA